MDGTEVEGGSEEGRGGDGGGREESEGGGEVEEGGGGPDSGRSGGGGRIEGGEGGRLERAKGVRIRGTGGGGGGEIFSGWGKFSKMSLLVSKVIIQVDASLLRSAELKMQGIDGESSKEQSAGETTTLGSDLSSTGLETVGKVENEE